MAVVVEQGAGEEAKGTTYRVPVSERWEFSREVGQMDGHNSKANTRFQGTMNWLTFSTLVLLLWANVATAADGDCARPDWSPHNGSCYRVTVPGRPVSMQDARQACYRLGADLASIHGEREDAFIRDEIQSNLGPSGEESRFFIGLFVSRQTVMAGPSLCWADGSPVDYVSGQNRSAEEHFWEEGVPSNWTNVFGNCATVGSGRAWASVQCSQLQLGFVCKKGSERLLASAQPTTLFPVFSVFSLSSQLYVVWLVANKSPQPMRNYRFYLCANTVFDAIATFSIGILFNPDLWLPHALAGSVNGLARHFGLEGGRITLCIVEFAVICQAVFQMISVVFRYFSVKQREHLKWHNWLSSRAAYLPLILLATATATTLTFATMLTMDDPAAMPDFIFYGVYNGEAQRLFSDALLEGKPTFMIKPFLMLQLVAGLSTAFAVAYAISIYFTAEICRYLRSNSKHFSKQTLQLQIQLVTSLIVQLILPFMFIGLPVLIAFVASILQWIPGKTGGQLGVFLFELYAFANPLAIVIFVTPFRRHTAKIIGFYAIMRRLFPNKQFPGALANTVVHFDNAAPATGAGVTIRRATLAPEEFLRMKNARAKGEGTNAAGGTATPKSPQPQQGRSMSIKF